MVEFICVRRGFGAGFLRSLNGWAGGVMVVGALFCTVVTAGAVVSMHEMPSRLTELEAQMLEVIAKNDQLAARVRQLEGTGMSSSWVEVP